MLSRVVLQYITARKAVLECNKNPVYKPVLSRVVLQYITARKAVLECIKKPVYKPVLSRVVLHYLTACKAELEMQVFERACSRLFNLNLTAPQPYSSLTCTLELGMSY